MYNNIYIIALQGTMLPWGGGGWHPEREGEKRMQFCNLQ